MDFYLCGIDLRRGIGLVASGYKTEEKAKRGSFDLSEKYAPLGVKDFAVVELRGNETGTIKEKEIGGAGRAANWIAVYFRDDEFKFCNRLSGDWAVKIDLRD